MSDYNPYSLEHPNASLTYIVAQLQKYLNDHPLTPDNDPDNPDQYNPVSLQLPYASLPWIVAWMQKALSEGTTDGTPYNPYSLQYPLASLPKIVSDIQKYLDTHPIITADEAGQFILDYIADNPGLFPVTSVNGATGAVTLGAADVGAVPTTRTVNGKALSADITMDASDVGAVPDTREINGHQLDADVTLVPSDLGAVPETRTINLVPLNDDIVLTPGDIGAVPEDREINGMPLSTDLTLTPADLGAVPVTRTINGIPLTSDITIPTGGVPPTRTINGKPLSSDVVLNGGDIISGVVSPGNSVNQDLWDLNEHVKEFDVYNFGSTTLSQFENDVITYAAALGTKKYKHIYVAFTASVDVVKATAYIGTLEVVSSATRLIIKLREAYDASPTDVELIYKDGTWTTFSLSAALATSTYNYTEWLTTSNNFLVTLSKIGTFVTMNLFFHTTSSGVAQNVTIGTIPELYRPSSDVIVYAHNATGNIFGAKVQSNGIVVHTSGSNQNNITVVAMWNTAS